MTVSADVAKENYRTGIEGIGGAAKYVECGRQADSGPAINVAKCLEAAKKSALSTEAMVARWAKRMFGA
jgi:hypothetical protein